MFIPVNVVLEKEAASFIIPCGSITLLATYVSLLKQNFHIKNWKESSTSRDPSNFSKLVKFNLDIP